MKNKSLERKLSDEILAHVASRKTLILSTLTQTGHPYASYAPFAFNNNCIYVLLSEIALHGHNLQAHPAASVLILEDEDTAAQLFARIRVTYEVTATILQVDSADWHQGIAALTERHGERVQKLSQLSDFKLFKLAPQGGRFVKGFGKAYTIEGESLTGDGLAHLTEGHRKRSTSEAVA